MNNISWYNQNRLFLYLVVDESAPTSVNQMHKETGISKTAIYKWLKSGLIKWERKGESFDLQIVAGQELANRQVP